MTRGAIADWVRNQMEDRSRSPAWLDAHGRSYSWGADGTFHPDYWVGEVDYTGPCDLARDSDCDHWYDEHDNCPTTYNPDQLDGAACPPPPPPLFLPTPPQNCVPWTLCNDGVEFRCDMIHEVVVLKRSDGGSFHDVSIDSDPDRAHIPFIQDYPGDGRDAALYRVCSRNADGNDACQLGPDFYVSSPTIRVRPAAVARAAAASAGGSAARPAIAGRSDSNEPAEQTCAASTDGRAWACAHPSGATASAASPRPAPPDATLDRGVGAPARDVGLAGRAERIACPTLVCSAERDEIGVTARKLFDALTCEKEFARW